MVAAMRNLKIDKAREKNQSALQTVLSPIVATDEI